jgi:hypothetical protein
MTTDTPTPEQAPDPNAGRPKFIEEICEFIVSKLPTGNSYILVIGQEEGQKGTHVHIASNFEQPQIYAAFKALSDHPNGTLPDEPTATDQSGENPGYQ